jgi:hypothetical protein
LLFLVITQKLIFFVTLSELQLTIKHLSSETNELKQSLLYVHLFRKAELGSVLRRYHSELLDCLLELGYAPDLYPFSQLLEDYQVSWSSIPSISY